MQRRFIIPVAVAVILIAGQAYLQGIWTQRWGQEDVSADIQTFAERMKNIPTSFGDWESVDSPIEQRELDASGSVSSYRGNLRIVPTRRKPSTSFGLRPSARYHGAYPGPMLRT